MMHQSSHYSAQSVAPASNRTSYDPTAMNTSPPASGVNPSHAQFHHPSYSNSNSASPGPLIQMPASPSASQHISSATAAQTKRPYRQRRKDPSCDACRERKVKCDATETMSCNECKSRGVKCQFTKETNRRMSSIKQVQDLEKQLAQAKSYISKLEGAAGRTAPDGPIMNGSEISQDGNLISIPAIGSLPQRRPLAPVAQVQDLREVRAHLRNYGRGVFKPPPPYRQVGIQAEFEHPVPQLPPNHIGDRLLAQYYQTIHAVIPILHWPQFTQRYEEVKRQGDLSQVPPAWGSILFAVFACGLLYTTDPDILSHYPDNGRCCIGYSRVLTDLFNDEFTIDHARSALLTSVFLTELNCKSAAWTWLGSTVRIAQDIGLHREGGPWAVVEGEMRRRVWWGIYVWDRLLSVEMGRVLLIDDKDCDIDLPCPLDDHFINESGVMINRTTPANFLLTTIHVVRMIGQLLRALQSAVISPHTLQFFDAHFRECQKAFPPYCHIYQQQPLPLEPRHLAPICHLQNCRLVLHRHNLTTACPSEVRITALRSCVDAAGDTVNLLKRVKLHQPSGASWQTLVAECSSTMLCTHIWRCMLFLCFAGLYDEALVCVEVSAAIGKTRDVNIACGRNLYGFLRMLAHKIAHGIELLHDEMMIALVSGDVQGSTESSWVWNGSETGAALNGSPPASHAHTPASASNGKESAVTDGSTESRTILSSEEKREWGGWGHVEEIIKQLKKEKEQRDFQHQATSAPTQPPRSHPALLAPWDPQAAASSTVQNASRISIANII